MPLAEPAQKATAAAPLALVTFDATGEVRRTIAGLGRCEDVKFSPDGRRLAIAGFSAARILVLEINRSFGADGPQQIELARPLTLLSRAFNLPHGISWADDETLLVANRAADVVAVRVPRGANAAELTVEPLEAMRCDETDMLDDPGSVSVRPIGSGLFEALVCNNASHRLTRHLLDGHDGFRVVSSEIVLRKRLDLPDGVAHSRSGRWVGVSNHNDRSVHIYRADQLGRSEEPAAVLRGMAYPHGLQFTSDDRAVLSADAGAPLVHVFSLADGEEWSGERRPSSSIEVVDAEVFRRGRKNDEEGGPKGLDLSADGTLLALSYEEMPLSFVDLRGVVRTGLPAAPVADGSRDRLVARLAATHEELGAVRRTGGSAGQFLGRASMEGRLAAAEARARDAEIRAEALVASSSWRLTAPLRRLATLLRRG